MAVKVNSAYADDISHDCQMSCNLLRQRADIRGARADACNPTHLGIILSH